jgi:peptidylprolyl isomerase
VTKAYDLLAMRHCVISVSSQQYHIRVQSIISSKERWTVSQTMSSQRWLINNKGKMKVFVCGLILLGVVRTAKALAMSMSMSGNSGVTETTTRRAFFVTAGSTAAVAAAAMAMPLSAAAAVDVSEFTTTESGLLYKVTKEGTGAIPGAGQMVKAHYTGWLDDFDSEKKFDSSRDRNKPFTFKVGAGQVIRGWDESFSSMAVGERRLIILPPRLGYEDRGAGGVIPGGATLYFDVELLNIL